MPVNPHPTVLSPMAWPAVNVAGSPQDTEVQRVGNMDVNGLLRVSGGALGVGSMGMIPENVWFVDDELGNDNNDGRCWNNAFATIQRAINQARYGASSGSLEYVIKRHHKYIFIRPGHYDLTSYISFSGYGMSLIGLSSGVPGKDYGVSLNYDGAIASVGVIAFSGSNLSIHNIHIYCDAAVPAIYMAGGDNNLIDGVVIEGDGVNCTAGIYAPSMKGSWIRNCVIHNCAKGIHLPGGANMYFIHGGIVGNQIHSDITGAKGIMIDGGMTVCYNASIRGNYIDVYGGGATAKGIDIDDTGIIMVGDNRVIVAGSAVGIEHAGLGVMANEVSVNGTPAGDSSHSVVDDATRG